MGGKKKTHSDAGFPKKATQQTWAHNAPIKCLDWNYSEDERLYFNIQSLEEEAITDSNERSPPSNMREQLAVKLRCLVPLRYLRDKQKQNSFTFFVTAELRQIDENNIVEMQTNYEELPEDSIMLISPTKM